MFYVFISMGLADPVATRHFCRAEFVHLLTAFETAWVKLGSIPFSALIHTQLEGDVVTVVGELGQGVKKCMPELFFVACTAKGPKTALDALRAAECDQGRDGAGTEAEAVFQKAAVWRQSCNSQSDFMPGSLRPRAACSALRRNARDFRPRRKIEPSPKGRSETMKYNRQRFSCQGQGCLAAKWKVDADLLEGKSPY